MVTLIPNELSSVHKPHNLTALNILKRYQEQRIEPINQDFMAYLRRELQDLESQRVNAEKQTTVEPLYKNSLGTGDL
jgi:hypothetical protein